MYFRQSVLALGVLACAWTAHADVTMVSQMKGKMMGMSPTGETITYIKGSKMRTDQTLGRDKTSTIMDVETGRMVTINHGKKEAEVWNMRDLAESMQKGGMEVGAAEVTITPTGRSKEIAGYAAQEYDISVSVDAGLPDAPIKMTMTVSGPSYMSTTAPGAEDYARFYQAAAANNIFFGDPRTAKAQPGRARGMMQMYNEMAAKGIPLESVQTIKMSGSGPMAAMMSKMGGGEMQSTVTSISDETLDASLFEIPAGYKVKEQKVK